MISTEGEIPPDLGSDAVAIDRQVDRSSTPLAVGGSERPSVWAYTTSDPGPGWNQPDYDDSAWARGPAGFGTKQTPGIRVGTTWDTERIWLRTQVELPALSSLDDLTLRLFHDEDVEIFVNGKPLFSTRGYVTAYRDIVLDETRRTHFHPGKNTLAVSCRQTGGGQGIDVGLIHARGR
jgi:hypothetical protein